MPARTALPVRPRLPLVVTSDPDLLDDLLRLAAAGGAEVDVAADPVAARARYATAPLVLVGADQGRACLRARLPRRSHVVLVGSGTQDRELWELAELVGAGHVALLPTAEPWLVERLGQPPTQTAEDARTIAVIGGRGGAGATVLAAGLAVTGVQAGLRTLLVDADPYGGGIDLVLGWELMDGLRWPALTEPGCPVEAPALVEALPKRGDLVVLSWDREDRDAHVSLDTPPEAMAAAMDAGRRGRDLVVIDLPRRLDDAAALALQAADRALILVPAELRATAAATRIAAIAVRHCEQLAVVVRGPSPGRLTARDVARSLGLPLVGVLRPEAGLPRALERGEAPTASGRGPLAMLCKRLVADLCEGREATVLP
ncbi:septum site-determining protein Ssd [Rhizomonospora bruguierae]|uniref:septum site-determining protein Ssd n=1 Tax=Rhizomonospora bruguierae TaxID=1581705 RepID=UPI001BCD663F|nr:septum site-determining protein Ssd [Micromonospora sp. NBRC 107566]